MVSEAQIPWLNQRNMQMSVYSTADNGMILLFQQQIDQCTEVQQQQTNPPQCAIGGIADHQRAGERGHHQRRQHQVGNNFVFRFQIQQLSIFITAWFTNKSRNHGNSTKDIYSLTKRGNDLILIMFRKARNQTR